MRIMLLMMDADQLMQRAEECLEENLFEDAKVCLKEAATQAPLRTDIRDMLVDVIAREAEHSSGQRKRRARGPAGWRFIFGTVGIILCLGLTVWGILIVRDYLDHSAQSPRDILNPPPTPTPAPTPTPPPTPDPRPALRAALIKEAEAFLTKGDIPSGVKKVDAWLVTKPTEEDASARKKMAERLFLAGDKRYIRGANAKAAAKQKDLRAAEMALLKAIELDPDNMKSYNTLARAYNKLRDRQSAVDYYQRIRLRKPGSPEAKEAERQLKQMSAPLDPPSAAQ